MIGLWFERSALLGALSSLVLAFLWPHVGPRLLPSIQKFFISPISAVLNRKLIITSEHSRKQNTIKEHPKFSGGSLRRIASDEESIYPTYRSSEGFGQSTLTSNPSFSMRIATSMPSSRRGNLNHRSSQAGGQSSTLLTIFTATMIALIIYTLMKMLRSKFAIYKKGNIEERDWQSPTSCLSSSNYRRVYKETKDLRQDKRRLARLSREERVRELILHHGGRNVSSAIRFLVGELEKQKHLLFKNLSRDLTCNCSCHTDYDHELPSPSEQESLDRSSYIDQ